MFGYVRAPAAIVTFLQASLTENVAAASEVVALRGAAGLAQAGVTEHGQGHGAAGQGSRAAARAGHSPRPSG